MPESLNRSQIINGERVQGYTTIAETKYMNLRSKDGYVYGHFPKWNSTAVAILPFRYTLESPYMEFLAINEARPNHGGDYYSSSLTGSYDDPSITLEETVIKELREEAGYIATVDELIPLGWTNSGKASDGVVNLYGIQLKENTPTCKLDPAGSKIEAAATPIWIQPHEVLNSKDMTLIAMFARLYYGANLN